MSSPFRTAVRVALAVLTVGGATVADAQSRFVSPSAGAVPGDPTELFPLGVAESSAASAEEWVNTGRNDGFDLPQRSSEPFVGPINDGRTPELVREAERLAATRTPYVGPLNNGRPPGTLPAIVGADDETPVVAQAASVAAEAAVGLALSPVLPNPASASATLRFSVEETGPATVAVYDLLGRRVRVVYDGYVTAGVEQTVRSDLADVAAGTYVAVLDASGQRVSRTFQVVR